MSSTRTTKSTKSTSHVRPAGRNPLALNTIRQARKERFPEEIKALTDDWEARKARLAALKEEKSATDGKQLSDAETEERKFLLQTTTHQRGPTYCAEPEIFLPMRRHSTGKTKKTKKLSVHALSVQLKKGKIQVIEACSNCRHAKNAIQGNWKEIVDMGAGRGGQFMSMPKAIVF